jgi:hypothetical protein
MSTFQIWSLIGYSPQIHNQQSVKKEQNRKHQRAEILCNIPVKKNKQNILITKKSEHENCVRLHNPRKALVWTSSYQNVRGCFHPDLVFTTWRFMQWTTQRRVNALFPLFAMGSRVVCKQTTVDLSSPITKFRIQHPRSTFCFAAYSNTPHPRISSSSLPKLLPCFQPTSTRRTSGHQLVTFKVENFVLRQ